MILYATGKETLTNYFSLLQCGFS